MSELCLSVAPTLRCQSLTRLESGLLLLPTGLELFFCLGLVLAKLGSDRKPLLLASEGFIYFILALIDAVIHVVPRVAMELNVFGPLDIVIGALSFAPLLLYTLFLLLYSTSELLATSSYRARNNMRLWLFIFIPVIVALNELGSFIAISYQMVGGMVVVGFKNLLAHTLFDDLVLAFLIAFQSFTLIIAFMRSVNAFRLRGSETVAEDNSITTHMLNGVLWMAVGILLGTAESAIGFIPHSFPAILVRRLLRLFGRACLIIGVMNGVDRSEDFRIEPRPQRRSMLRNLVSGPRTSTLLHVGGHGFDPQTRTSVVRTPEMMERPFNHRFSDIRRSYSPLPDPPVAGPSRFRGNYSSPTPPSIPGSQVNTFTTDFNSGRSTPQQRVTIHFTSERVPVLQLRRFSDWSLQKAVTGAVSEPSQEVRPSQGHARAKSMPLEALLHQYRTSSTGSPPSRRPAMATLSSEYPGSSLATAGHDLGTTSSMRRTSTFGTAGHAPGTPQTRESVSSSQQQSEDSVVVNAVHAYSTPYLPTLTPHRASLHPDVVTPPMDRKHSSSTSDTLDAVRTLAPQFPRVPRPNSASADSGYAASRLALGVQDCVVVQGKPGDDDDDDELPLEDLPATRPISPIPPRPTNPVPPTSPRSRSSTLLQDVLDENFRRASRSGSSSQGLSIDTREQAIAPPAVPWPEASLPTPMSMDMRMSSRRTLPARVPNNAPPCVDVERSRKARTLSAKAMQVAAEEKAESESEGVTLGRVRSIGSAPRRIRPTPSVTYTRGSVAAEVDLSAFTPDQGKIQRSDSTPVKRQPSRLKKKRYRKISTATTIATSGSISS